MVETVTSTDTSRQRRFTIAEYRRMAESGILAPDERVELLRGVVCRMSPKSRAQVIAVHRAYDVFRDVLRGRAGVYVEAPLRLERLASEPEPDLSVYASPERDDFGAEDRRPLLLIEVADSSLRTDLGRKAALYAEAQVPEYWVVNLEERVLVVLSDPRAGSYQERSVHEPGTSIVPIAWPDVRIQVDSLFPRARA